jgi:amino acid adenylation domain-containing protein
MVRLLSEYAAQQAALQPQRIALSMGNSVLSYSDLERLSNQIARATRESGCKKSDRVCLLLEKSPDAIAAMIGVIKAGCAYVPLDVNNPAARLGEVIRASQPRLLLCSQSTAAVAARVVLGSCPGDAPLVGSLALSPADAELPSPVFTRQDLALLPDDAVANHSGPDDVAHLLFTSGSTGKPKGVAITHSNVIAFVDWAVRYFGIGNRDRLSGHAPLHFDLSTFDIFGAFAAGAELHLVAPELNLLPNKLAEFIRNSGLTQWFSVPAVLAQLAKFDAVQHGDFPMLKRVLWCGEVLPTPALIYWMQRLPQVEFTNLYGPTETTIASSYHTVRQVPASQADPVPIGTACDGEELVVMDESLRPVPAGHSGFLYIGGAGLSPGYWNEPELTARAFLSWSDGSAGPKRMYRTGDLARVGPDGLVYFLGRSDSQIKSRGYRIELGEIESALSTMDALRESAVVAIDAGGWQGQSICCAFVPSAPGAATAASLRFYLTLHIPNYMLPQYWLPLERLPRNGNGKIDRRRLREEFEGRCFGETYESAVKS